MVRPNIFRGSLVFFAAIVSVFAGNLPAHAAKNDSWVEVQSPHFNIVSNAGEKQARKTAVQFEQIRSVFRNSLQNATRYSNPVITILAVKDEESMRELLPEYWQKDGRAHPAGIFFSPLDQFHILIRLNLPESDPNAAPYEAIYHEYYHSLSTPFFPFLPTWIEEGLADFYGNSEVDGKRAIVGRPDPNRLRELLNNPLIPLEVLFKVDHTSPYYNEQSKTSIFYAESWALVHYLMLGDRGAHRQMFDNYVAVLAKGAPEEQAASKAFGDLKSLQDALVRYIGSQAFFAIPMPAPDPVPDQDSHFRALSEAESEAYRGGFFAIRGRMQEGKPLLEDAIRLEPNLAIAYQYLALGQVMSGQRDEALSSASRAIALAPNNGMTRYLRASLTIGDGRTGDESNVEQDLRQAIAVNPDFAPPYGMLALYVADRSHNLPEALNLAQKAVSMEPGNGDFALDLAQVLAQMNRYDQARAEAMRARALARNPQRKTQAEQFLAYLQKYESMAGDASGTQPATKEAPQ